MIFCISAFILNKRKRKKSCLFSSQMNKFIKRLIRYLLENIKVKFMLSFLEYCLIFFSSSLHVNPKLLLHDSYPMVHWTRSPKWPENQIKCPHLSFPLWNSAEVSKDHYDFCTCLIDICNLFQEEEVLKKPKHCNISKYWEIFPLFHARFEK